MGGPSLTLWDHRTVRSEVLLVIVVQGTVTSSNVMQIAGYISYPTHLSYLAILRK